MMPILVLMGLPGVGKTTLASGFRDRWLAAHLSPCEILDGDLYRRGLNRDLGFSRDDRVENNRRLGFVASRFAANGVLPIIAAIAPHEEGRQAIFEQWPKVSLVHLRCDMGELLRRDPKGMYRRAMLPASHPDHVPHLTGVSDPFEHPAHPAMTLRTDWLTEEQCLDALWDLLVISDNERTNP
jgi:adenylylsulfate kinase